MNQDFVLRIPLKTYLSFESSTEREVWLAIYSFSNNGSNECWASQRSIATRARLSQDSVCKKIKDLITHGYIQANGERSVKGGKTMSYVLSERPAFTNDDNQPLSERLPSTKEKKANGTAVLSERYSGTKQLKETIKENTSSSFKEEDRLELANQLMVSIHTVNRAEKDYLEWHKTNKPGKKPLLLTGVRNWIKRGLASGDFRLTTEGLLKKEGY